MNQPQELKISHHNISLPIQSIQYQAAALLIYQSVLADDISKAFLKLLQKIGHIKRGNLDSEAVCLRAYGSWFSGLASINQSWQDYLVSRILQSDNPFTKQAQQAKFQDLSTSLIAAAQHDLQILQQLYASDERQVSRWICECLTSTYSPVVWQQELQPHGDEFTLHHCDNWAKSVNQLADHYRQRGTGLFATYKALRWRLGILEGIAYPDLVKMEDLVGYEMPRKLLLKNTEALLLGNPALHILLYGSRGSGKSSLVKSLLAKYSDCGLRLVEVTKSELIDLPHIVDWWCSRSGDCL